MPLSQTRKEKEPGSSEGETELYLTSSLSLSHKEAPSHSSLRHLQCLRPAGPVGGRGAQCAGSAAVITALDPSDSAALAPSITPPTLRDRTTFSRPPRPRGPHQACLAPGDHGRGELPNCPHQGFLGQTAYPPFFGLVPLREPVLLSSSVEREV